MPPAKCTLKTPPKTPPPDFLHDPLLPPHYLLGCFSCYSDRELRLSDQEKHKRNTSPSHVHSEWPALLSEKRWSPRGHKIGKRINLHNAKARYKTTQATLTLTKFDQRLGRLAKSIRLPWPNLSEQSTSLD